MFLCWRRKFHEARKMSEVRKMSLYCEDIGSLRKRK